MDKKSICEVAHTIYWGLELLGTIENINENFDKKNPRDQNSYKGYEMVLLYRSRQPMFCKMLTEKINAKETKNYNNLMPNLKKYSEFVPEAKELYEKLINYLPDVKID